MKLHDRFPKVRLPLWATLLAAVLLAGAITLLALWCQPNALRSVRPGDEALLPGNWLRGARVARSGGTVRPIPPRFPASACEVVNFSVCSVPEGRGVVPVPDFPPQILFWLASALEVRAGPCAVRIG